VGAALGLAVLVPALLSGCGQTTTGPGSGAGTAGSPNVPPTEDSVTEQPSPTDATTDPTTAPPPSALPGAADLPADPSGAELTLLVSGPDGDRPPVVLSCDFAAGTATGDHPQAAQACTDLLAAVQAGDPFAPVPADAMCTQVFGGEAVVAVSGAVLAADGGPVDVHATFSQQNGCEISRWQRMGAVLSPWGGGA